jgi:YD repeat-containing protein
LGLGARVLAREGHLVKVTEPNPEGGLLDTTYTYSELGQLLTVNMTRGGVTQTRTWAYDADKRERLVSVTHPESGTTLFSYNNDGTVAEKTDAKMQKLVYEYDADANGRLKLVKRLLAGGNEDICQRVTPSIARSGREIPTFWASASQPGVRRVSRVFRRSSVPDLRGGDPSRGGIYGMRAVIR